MLRAHGGRSRKERGLAIREYTEAPIRQGRVDDPWDRVVGGAVLGDLDDAKRLLAEARADSEEQAEARRLERAGRVPRETLVGWVEKERGMTWGEALARHRDWTRDGVLYLAVRHAGYALSEVQRLIPGLKHHAAAQAVKRFATQGEQDPLRKRFIRQLAAGMSTIWM
mgnify:FL=1